MSFLSSPLLTTPLLKIPLLVGNGLVTYYAMTPPTPIAQKSEHKANADFTSNLRLAKFLRLCTFMSKLFFCGVAATEVIAILAHQHPTLGLSETVTRLLPVPATLRVTATSVAACLVGSAGGLIRLWCNRTLGRFFTWEVTVRENHQLITTGPYAIVRHPGYTANSLNQIGNVMLLTAAGSYYTEAGLWNSTAGMTAGYAVIGYRVWLIMQLFGRASKEDKLLRATFGEQWDEWAKRTQYRLIPFIY